MKLFLVSCLMLDEVFNVDVARRRKFVDKIEMIFVEKERKDDESED